MLRSLYFLPCAQILTEEIDKLCEQINVMHNPSPFDFCRRGALYRKVRPVMITFVSWDFCKNFVWYPFSLLTFNHTYLNKNNVFFVKISDWLVKKSWRRFGQVRWLVNVYIYFWVRHLCMWTSVRVSRRAQRV